jgi:hypothetical protein
MSIRGRSVQPESRPLGAAIGLVALLFVAAVFVFLSRDVSRLDLLRSTFTPGGAADYAFTLEQRVAPQRAVSQRAD